MPRRLTLLIPGLTGGGAEKVIARMANHWAAQGEHVTLITLSTSADDRHALAPAVERIALGRQADSRGIMQALAHNWQRIHALGEAIDSSRPDAVISFTEQMNVLTLLAMRRRRSAVVIISERVDPRHHAVGRAWNALRRLSYRWSDCLVVQTEALARHGQALTHGGRVEVIPNGIDPPEVELRPSDRRETTVVAAGRLVPQKGFDLLLEAFAPLAERFSQWRLEIYGEGPLRPQLAARIAELHLDKQVDLPGWRGDLPSVLARSSIFALSSRYEGFPNALLDAMACGAACVSFSCPSGPEEIVRHAIDGLLVPPENVAEFSAALAMLMSDANLRERLGQRGREVVERFGYATYFARWERLIAELRDRPLAL